MKKLTMLAVAGVAIAGLVFSTANGEAATKKYTVTVKYVGDDKKVLRTVKKSVARNATFKVAKLSTRDAKKYARNYAYKSGATTLKIIKNQTRTVTYKRMAYDVKFVIKKSDVAKPVTVLKTVKKGATLKYAAPKISWYQNVSKSSFTVKPKKDMTYHLGYKRMFKFIINFVDVNGEQIQNRTYANTTPIPSKSVIVLDGNALNYTLSDNTGVLRGWNISQYGISNQNLNNGIQHTQYLSQTGKLGYLTPHDAGATVKGNRLTTKKITNSSWKELRSRALKDGIVSINVNYAPNVAYWIKQYQAQTDATVNQLVKSSRLTKLTAAQSKSVTGLKTALRQTISSTYSSGANHLLEQVKQTGSWQALITEWSHPGVKLSKLTKTTPLQTNEVGQSFGDKMYLGFDTSFVQTPRFDQVFGYSPKKDELTSNFVLTTPFGEFFVAEDKLGRVALVKKATSPSATEGFYAR